MNGKHHEFLNYISLIAAISIILTSSIVIHLKIQHLVYFSILWIIGTRYITPDLDTNSKSRKRLGFIGWIIDMLFHHRGMLHNPIFWVVIWILGVYLTGWWFTGVIVPQYIHIITDWLSTGVKRVLPKCVWKWVEKVI